jgi:hypothetical protein
MFHKNRVVVPCSTHRQSRLAKRSAPPFCKRKLAHAARVMGPSLIALAFAGVAHTARAQGAISFSGAQTFMQTVQTFAIYAGTVIFFGGLIFAQASFIRSAPLSPPLPHKSPLLWSTGRLREGMRMRAAMSI